MQWKKITTSVGRTSYDLWNSGRKLLTLAYKGQADGVYIEFEDGEKRHFKYRKRGLLKNKLVLENEYGTGLGKLKKDGSREFFIVDEKRYYINFLNNQKVEIVGEEDQKTLAVCTLDVDSSSPKAKNGLLMVLCYYIIGHPQTRDEFAIA